MEARKLKIPNFIIRTDTHTYMNHYAKFFNTKVKLSLLFDHRNIDMGTTLLLNDYNIIKLLLSLCYGGLSFFDDVYCGYNPLAKN